MARYRLRPPEVDAVQWRGDPTDSAVMDILAHKPCGITVVNDCLVIQGPQAPILVQPGWWILRYDNGAIRFCEPGMFATSYELIPGAEHEFEERTIQ